MMSKTLQASDGSRIGLIAACPGAPLVLLHGVGMCAEAWAPQIAAFAATRQVIALDLPGHGRTDALKGAPTLADYVAWAARAIAGLDLGPVALAGHSMGALIALGTAIEHPHLVERVALLNPVHKRGPAAREAVLCRARELAQGRSDPEAPLARWFAPHEAPEVRDRVGGWLRAVDADGYAATYAAFAEGDAVYADRIGEVRCPTLVLTGEHDANSSPDMTCAIAAGIGNARAVVIAGARHMASLTAPDRVNTELARWLGLPEGAVGGGGTA
jgi:pimeloyl-ACP methyl ester carboxylesterase